MPAVLVPVPVAVGLKLGIKFVLFAVCPVMADSATEPLKLVSVLFAASLAVMLVENDWPARCGEEIVPQAK